MLLRIVIGPSRKEWTLLPSSNLSGPETESKKRDWFNSQLSKSKTSLQPSELPQHLWIIHKLPDT